jgi:hypothetical protein
MNSNDGDAWMAARNEEKRITGIIQEVLSIAEEEMRDELPTSEKENIEYMIHVLKRSFTNRGIEMEVNADEDSN